MLFNNITSSFEYTTGFVRSGKVRGKCPFHLGQGLSGKVREACNGPGKNSTFVLQVRGKCHV